MGIRATLEVTDIYGSWPRIKAAPEEPKETKFPARALRLIGWQDRSKKLQQGSGRLEVTAILLHSGRLSFASSADPF
jgi:hypothetical protein